MSELEIKISDMGDINGIKNSIFGFIFSLNYLFLIVSIFIIVIFYFFIFNFLWPYYHNLKQEKEKKLLLNKKYNELKENISIFKKEEFYSKFCILVKRIIGNYENIKKLDYCTLHEVKKQTKSAYNILLEKAYYLEFSDLQDNEEKRKNMLSELKKISGENDRFLE